VHADVSLHDVEKPPDGNYGGESRALNGMVQNVPSAERGDEKK
jgi:hypothetical protein